MQTQVRPRNDSRARSPIRPSRRVLLAAVLATGLGAPSEAAAGKVQICHVPPGDPANRAILSVSENSLPAHLAHGDNPLALETCDGIDNDCDGLVDEGPGGGPLTQPTTCGVGVCSGNVGFETCVGGQFTGDTCDPLAGASPETCDSLDNDCDGALDEDAFGDPLTRPTTCGVGQCAGNTGLETCTNGLFAGDTCNPFDGATGEICNGADDNCNGQTDEAPDLCDLGEICSPGGCIVDPALTCPCDLDLDLAMWDDGSIPFGGCVGNDGDGFPRFGQARELFGGPQGVSFILNALDIEPDGVRDYTCVVCTDEDGIGGVNPVCASTLPVSEADLLGCAVRFYGLPENVVQCVQQ